MIKTLERYKNLVYVLAVGGLPILMPFLFFDDSPDETISPFPAISCSIYLVSIFYFVYSNANQMRTLRPNNGYESFHQFIVVVLFWELITMLICGKSFLTTIPIHTWLFLCQSSGLLLSMVAFFDNLIPHTKTRLEHHDFESNDTSMDVSGGTNFLESQLTLFKKFFLGIHLEPTIGNMDLKFFWIGRVGMHLWFLISLRFFAKILVNNDSSLSTIVSSGFALCLIYGYIVDFYKNEDWYCQTLDMIHDKFGFMMAWGPVVWMPFIYSYVLHDIQSSLETNTSLFYAIFWFSGGLLGLYFFRLINGYRIKAREILNHGRSSVHSSSLENDLLWKPDGILVKTVKGHQTHFVTSGPYSICRHPNYLADLVWCFCLCSLGPTWKSYLFFCFLVVLLIHRCKRDEDRCFKKYGSDWRRYCSIIPYRMIPKVY